MPEFLDRHAAREQAKFERLAPHIEAAMARKAWRRPLPEEEIPTIRPYGSASFIPSEADEVASGVSAETKGALGLS